MTKESFRSFEDLECWKACTEVRRFITELVKKYPKDEKYSHELIDQLITSLDESHITDGEYERGRELINGALVLLNGYILNIHGRLIIIFQAYPILSFIMRSSHRPPIH